MTNEKISDNKRIFKKWWFWVIVVIVLGVISLITNPTETPVVTNKDKDGISENTMSDSFNSQFLNICSILKTGYADIATIDCQDDTTWTANNKANPGAFPYEYRDISVDFSGKIAYEVKVVKDASKMDYFKTEYTCKNVFGGLGTCVIGEAEDSIIYSIIIYDKDDQAEANKLSNELKQILNK